MSLKLYVATRQKQKVTRVLLMIEYAGKPEGDVYDLTELSADMMRRAKFGSSIGVSVRTEYKWEHGKKEVAEQTVEFSGNADQWCSGATHIEDVVNFCLPDGEKVTSLKRKATRLRKQADQCDSDAHYEKLMQVAAVRGAHPIAKFHMDQAPVALPASSA